MPPDPEAIAALRRLGAAARGLRLFVLFGSRAQGRPHALSDWDLGYLADATFDPDGLLAQCAEALGADRIDLVDLDRASALLRHRAASDGVALFEQAPRTFEQFQIDAWITWCDLEPVLGPAYERVLERLRS